MMAATLGHAHEFKSGDLEITHPYARPSRPGQLNGSAWFGVNNAGSTGDRIIGVQSEVAKHTEIHDMDMQGGVMRMFKVDGVDVPAGGHVKLGEGNKLHVMLLELEQPLKAGDRFPLTIQFEHAGSVPVEVWVEEPRDGAATHGHSHH
ncbi:copper chaperone PCu(A)C [Corticibacter populi]|uniref:Copper chaperone PCu(A)C n=2 Tax=Corticibacter populi TaxID=1550736 RepID=A0A3M6R0S2_9BURK|nr:copper chaperone PCu(A)C [Corticibacter populi]